MSGAGRERQKGRPVPRSRWDRRSALLIAVACWALMASCARKEAPKQYPLRPDWARVQCFRNRYAFLEPPQGVPPETDFECPHGGHFYCPHDFCIVTQVHKRRGAFMSDDATRARPLFLEKDHYFWWIDVTRWRRHRQRDGGADGSDAGIPRK
jgi:hypothetical protein